MRSNAELTLHLIEQGLELHEAKAIAETEPNSVAELTLAIVELTEQPLANAKAIAAEAPIAVLRAGKPSLPTKPDREYVVEDVDPNAPVIHGTYVPIVGADGLTDAQRRALGNVGLCPNCQQPNTSHLPGCARIQTGYLPPVDPRAVTKDRLPAASE